MENIVDKIFVINLDKQVKRMERMTGLLSSFGWNFERFPAINGRELTEKQSLLESQYIRRPSILGKGEIGCLLSHLSLWKRIAEDDSINRALIFEDDADTQLNGPSLDQHITTLYDHLRINDIKEPEMIYLGKALDDCLSYKRLYGNVYYSERPLCMHAYIITKNGARMLLQTAPFFYPADVIPHYIAGENFKILVFHPSLFFQQIFDGDSNLRTIVGALNLTAECSSPSPFVSIDTWVIFVLLIIVLIAIMLIIMIPHWVPEAKLL